MMQPLGEVGTSAAIQNPTEGLHFSRCTTQVTPLAAPDAEPGSGEALAQVGPEKLWMPLPGSVQGQVGQGFEQPGLVEGVPAHGRGVGKR